MKRLALVAVSLSLSFGSVFGQSTELGLNLGAGKLTGDDFEGMEVGFVVGGHLLFGPEKTRYGFALDYGTYGEEGLEEKTRALGFFGVIRQTLPGESAQFFTGGKFGYVRLSADVLDIGISADGFGVGPMFGVHIPLTGMALEIAVEGLYVMFGEMKADGETIPDTDSSGLHFSGRLGISVPIGGQR